MSFGLSASGALWTLAYKTKHKEKRRVDGCFLPTVIETDGWGADTLDVWRQNSWQLFTIKDRERILVGEVGALSHSLPPVCQSTSNLQKQSGINKSTRESRDFSGFLFVKERLMYCIRCNLKTHTIKKQAAREREKMSLLVENYFVGGNWVSGGHGMN